MSLSRDVDYCGSRLEFLDCLLGKACPLISLPTRRSLHSYWKACPLISVLAYRSTCLPAPESCIAPERHAFGSFRTLKSSAPRTIWSTRKTDIAQGHGESTKKSTNALFGYLVTLPLPWPPQASLHSSPFQGCPVQASSNRSPLKHSSSSLSRGSSCFVSCITLTSG